MIYLLGFFTWLATAQAVENDDRIAQGLEPHEKLNNEKVLVWPDLVYTELICMVAITALLLIWGLALQAPLEEPASRVKTPNPSKAPWYFLGLQEMLVYYDPWMAGVVLPSLIIVGLMAIPYLDFNKEGNGYFTINQRKFSYLIFQFGFLELWVTLIILGTFFRGPNWNIFGPFEEWDAAQGAGPEQCRPVAILLDLLARQGAAQGSARQRAGADVCSTSPVANGWASCWCWATSCLLPPLMATTVFRKFFVKMGFIRFMLHGEPVFVHVGAAHQDGPAVDLQPEIHHRHSGVLFEFLTRDACALDRPAS